MKLYEYSIKRDRQDPLVPASVHVEAIEVKETPKQYRAIDGEFRSYNSVLPKTDVGKLRRGWRGKWQYISTSPDEQQKYLERLIVHEIMSMEKLERYYLEAKQYCEQLQKLAEEAPNDPKT